MKKFFFSLIASLGLILSFSNTAHSTHVAGTDITYQCLGNDSFLITINVFRDCSPTSASWTYPGIGVGFGGGTITANSSCGQTINLSLPTTNTVIGNQAVGIDVSQLCPTAISSCSGGTHPGMELFTYTTIVVLAPPCNTWTIGYNAPCCRNTSINLVNPQGGMYSSATLNSVTDSCNSSPIFSTINPNPYACLGQLICYDLGVTEPDGDSLVYSFDAAYSAAGVQYNYNAGYSGAVPITGITIDPQTGKIQFTPTIQGNFVIVVKVCEYEYGTGLLKGCVKRDLQWVINNCNNNAPSQLCSPNSIISFSGTGAQTTANTVEVCYGQNFSFVILVSDSFGLSSTQYLTATTNVLQVLPGSQFTVVSNTNQDSLWITISWTATIGAAPFNTFNVAVSDNNCPVTATNSGLYVVKVIPSTYAGLNQQMCRSEGPLNLTAIGGNIFNWSVISGDQTSLSCTACASPTVNPDSTTLYEVTSDLSTSCKNKDTVMVMVSKNFNLSTPNDTLICFNDSSIPLFVYQDIIRNFDYKWSPKNALDYDTAASPMATPISNTLYQVTVSTDSGCVKSASYWVRTTLPFPKSILATTISGDTVSCQGIPIQLDAQLAVAPTSCGVSSNPCNGLQFYHEVGTGTGTNSTTGGAQTGAWPAPYGGSQKSVRNQFIITKNELASLGIGAGTISSLGFNVMQVQGTADYDNFTIKIGCISDSTFALIGGSYWKQNLVTVFTPKTVSLNTGWNMHDFDFAYDYNGTSHLIVEICYFNTGTNTSNSLAYRSTTNFGASLFNYSSSVSICNSSNLVSPPVNLRPNMRFQFCSGPDPAGYNFLWSPNSGLSSNTDKSPYVTLQDSITYTLAVEDTAGKCFDTSKVKLILTTIDISNDTSVCPNTSFSLFANGKTTCAGGANFLWTPSALVNNDTISNPTAVISANTMFYVTYQDQCGCTIFDSVYVTTKSIDTLGIIRNIPSCGVANGVLFLQPRGGVMPYQFSIDSGLTFQTDSIFNDLNNGYFDILVKDSEGCMIYKNDTFSNTAPIIDSLKIFNLSCFESSDGIVNIYTSGGILPLSYSLDGGSTYNYNDTIIGLTAGLKSIQVKSKDGCVTALVDTTLKQPELLKFDLTEDVVSCFGYPDGKLKIEPSGGTLPYRFNWSTLLGVDTIADSLYSGTYTVSILDTNSCFADSIYFLSEPDLMVIDSINYQPITCHGYRNGVIKLFLSGGNSGYTYSVDSGATFYTSSTFDSIAPIAQNIIVKDYKGCSVDTVEVFTEPDELIITPIFDTTIICVSNCIEVAAPFIGGNQGKVTYFWSPTFTDSSSFQFCPTKDSKFIVYAKDSKNCISNIAEMYINLYDSLSIEISVDTHICVGFGQNLNVESTGGDGSDFNYEWTPYFGLNNPKIKSPFANPVTSTTYTVEVTDNCGSPAVYDQVYIEVFPNPEVDFATNETEGCEQQLIYFYNNSNIGFDCFWDFGDGSTAQECTFIAHPYTKPGFYDVKLRVYSSGGCSDSLTNNDLIRIYPNPRADFIMNPQPATIIEPEVQFTDLSEGVISKWEWNFGSFMSSEEQNPLIEFPVNDSGNYPVRLSITTNEGCYDDTVKLANADIKLNIYSPTGFTPNNDNVNDFFFPQGTGMDGSTYEFFIFDRWGKVMFESNDLNFKWDGNFSNGEPAPVGIYVWKLVVGDYTDLRERHEVTGTVSLMR